MSQTETHHAAAAAREWRRAEAIEQARRRARDDAIRAAAAAGAGPRAIARAVGMDDGAVSRIIRGERGAAVRR